MTKRKTDTPVYPIIFSAFGLVVSVGFIVISVYGIKDQKHRDEFEEKGIWQHVMLYVCSYVTIPLLLCSLILFADNNYLRVIGVIVNGITILLLFIFGFCTLAGYITFDYGYSQTFVKNRIEYETKNKCCHYYDKAKTEDGEDKYWVKTFRDCKFINEAKDKQIEGLIRIDNSTCKTDGATSYCDVIEQDEKISLFCSNTFAGDKIYIMTLMILEFAVGALELVILLFSIYMYWPAFKALYSHLKGIQKTESMDSDDEINHLNDDKDVDMNQ